MSSTKIFRSNIEAPSERPSGLDASPLLLERLWGRLGEIDRDAGGGQTSLATSLVAEAQKQKRPVAWVQAQEGPLYPPDVAAAGVDVAALAVVRVGEPTDASARLRATEWLLMRGAFGLVVVDLNDALVRTEAFLGRLLRHARQYRSSVVFLTSRSAAVPSLGALVSLRLAPTASPVAPVTALPMAISSARPAFVGGAGLLPPGAFDLDIDVRKSKAGPLPGSLWLARRGPLGL